jgi:HlyD family secretion protein
MNHKLAALRRTSTGDRDSKSLRAMGPRFRILTAKLTIGGAALLMGVVLLYLFGERFLPASAVQVETVLSVESTEDARPRMVGMPSANPFAGSVQFQSSGWIEADPFLTKVTALYAGVVRDVQVLEGQAVKAGDLLATFVQEDAMISLRRAEHAKALAMASVEVAKAERDIASIRLNRATSELKAAKGRLEELSDLARRAEAMGGEVIPEQEIAQSVLRERTQAARVEAVEADLEQARVEWERSAGRLAMAESEAAAVGQELAMRQLEFSRTEVRAPVDGLVQRLFVVPGQKRMLAADDPDSATVASLYDPDRLQARIDVPLVEAAKLFTGQAVLVETELLPGRAFEGHVTRIAGEADLQRNTLQVKVSLHSPDGRLRPEMLCRAKFLETSVSVDDVVDPLASNPSAVGGLTDRRPGTGLSIYIPEAALFNRSGMGAAVFAVDPSGRRVVQRDIELGLDKRGAYVEVRTGLNPGDRVVVQNGADLKSGSRIKPLKNPL